MDLDQTGGLFIIFSTNSTKNRRYAEYLMEEIVGGFWFLYSYTYIENDAPTEIYYAMFGSFYPLRIDRCCGLRLSGLIGPSAVLYGTPWDVQ